MKYMKNIPPSTQNSGNDAKVVNIPNKIHNKIYENARFFTTALWAGKSYILPDDIAPSVMEFRAPYAIK